MERNREGRRTSNNMAAPANGLSSARRRHRSSSLRDSPDEEGAVEMHESGRLRDRNVVKKDRDRDRERDRERERASRSKRRRENRMMIHQGGSNNNNINSNNRDEGDDSSEESVYDEEEEDEDAGNGGGLRMLPPPPANPSTSAATNHSHNYNNSSYSQQQIQHRKSSFPSSGNNNNKVFRASGGPPPPGRKVSDEVIGVSVPRKARSASTKRSHEWSSGGSVIGGGGTEQLHRQSSTSPSRLASSAASPAPMAPPSPSSSNASVRKKMKANGGAKPRPPKSSSKSSSSNPEELEIEIAEVLYGLMTQSQAPSKKETPPNDGNKSRVSSPVSNSAAMPQNSTSLSAVAPKRKRPRQVSDNPNPSSNPFSVRNSPVSSSIKTEMDHQHHQSPKTEISSSYLENSSPAAAENGVSSFGFTTLPGHQAPPSSEPSAAKVEEEAKSGVGVVLTKEEVEKESLAAVGLNERNSNNTEGVITTAASTMTTDLKPANPETERQKEEKFEIDLMAPPPQQRNSQQSDGDVDLSNHKQLPSSDTKLKTEEGDKVKTGREEAMNLTEEQKKSKSGSVQEAGEASKQTLNLELHNDFEKSNKDSASNRSLHQALKDQRLSTKSETHTEKTAQPSSLPVPMPVSNWPSMGYVAPLQGVISMDGSTAPIQPLFTQPRPKRCATHCYIARNIHYLQQLMKVNPFWPAASGHAAPMFSAKHCNPNGMPSTEPHANITLSMHDKGQQVGIFPGHGTGKDTKSSQTGTTSDPAQRKQQVLLQQAMPPVAPNNILPGPAFIFPFNQQAVASSASVRPGSSKLSSSTTGGLGAASGAANSATVSCSTTAAAAPVLSFNYPNMTPNESQYLAIVQNHPYAFPIPAVGAGPPNYRGNHPHAQPMPVFNAPFYSSQMIHPSQIQQPPQQATQSQQTHQNSSSSTSSSQKHLQAQQRQDGSNAAAAIAKGSISGNGGGLHNSYSAGHKSRPQQLPQHMNPLAHNEGTGGEDSPSTADSRVSRAATNTMSVYGSNFAMPVHSQNFAMMYPQAAGGNSNDKKQQQQSQQQQQVLKRAGAESSSLSPQAFAMSFAPMNGTMAQNHAFFQSLPESIRQSYHHMMASPAAAASGHPSEQKKDFRISEEATRTGHESSNADEDRKVSAGLTAKSGQSIAFSRPDLGTDASGSAAAISGTSVIDTSSSRNINLGSSNRSTRSPISTSGAASHPLHVKFQQQQQSMNARSKNPPSSNGMAYPDHLLTSSSSIATKFSSFPLQTSNTNSSPVQSPQWRNSVRGPTTSQVPSSLASTTTSSLKYHHQTQPQQSSRPHPQSHTQISFGAAAASQKLQSTSTQSQNLSSNNSGNQSSSPPMLVGSPTASFSSSQPKNSLVGTQRSSPSILGNPHNSSSSNKSQQQQQVPQQLHKQTLQQQQVPQQLHKQTLQQQQAQANNIYAQMMYTQQPYMTQPPQAQQHSVGSGYYPPRKQQQQSSNSSAMLSLSPPVTLANTTTSDPAKAIAAATSNLKGSAPYSGNAAAGFPQYVQNATAAAAAAAVQVKPAEQKQPAA